MSKVRDLTGLQFDRLKVIERSNDHIQKNGRRRIMWKCQCTCGNSTIVYGDNLKKGVSKSCGCLRKEVASKRRSSHHESKDRLYGIWCSMKSRCYNKNTAAFKDYGGRGIIICDSWQNSYKSFAKWAKTNGYTDSASIDRIDNNGDYTPENCRWTDAKEQARNRRNNVLITYRGETHNITDWARILKINPKTLFYRYYSGKSVEEILKHTAI